MRTVGFLTLGWLLFLLPAVASGQQVPSPYRFLETRHAPGAYGGYLMTDRGDLDLAPHSAPIYGIRYDFHLTGPLSAEANVGSVSTERTIYARSAGGAGSPLDEIGPADAFLLLADAALKFHVTGQRAWRGIAPFGLVGAGLAIDLAGADEAEAAISPEQRFSFGPAFAASAGLGSDFFLTERLSLRAEVRDYLWRLNYPGGITESGARENDWTHNFAVTLGGAIHF